MSDWREYLNRAIADLGGISAVSRALCGTTRLRPRLSLAANGKYFGTEAELERLILDRFARVKCPWVGMEIALAECRATAGASAPTHNPGKLKHWRACQSCEIGKNLTQGDRP